LNDVFITVFKCIYNCKHKLIKTMNITKKYGEKTTAVNFRLPESSIKKLNHFSRKKNISKTETLVNLIKKLDQESPKPKKFDWNNFSYHYLEKILLRSTALIVITTLVTIGYVIISNSDNHKLKIELEIYKNLKPEKLMTGDIYGQVGSCIMTEVGGKKVRHCNLTDHSLN